MTAFQTYAETPSAGQAGHIAASAGATGHSRTLVRAVDAAIDGALGVTDGTTVGKTVKAPTSAVEAKRLLGILLDPVYLNEIGATSNNFSAGQPATVLEEGYVWVNAEATVAVGDDVYVRHTSDGGSNTTRGTFRPDCDTPSGGIRITPTASPSSTTVGYQVTLRTKAGIVETFVFDGAAATNVNAIATGLSAVINNSANFDAVDNTGSLNITVQGGGAGQVEVVSLGEHLTLSIGNRAERVVGAEFVSAVTGAGLAKVRLRGLQKQHKAA